MNQILSLPGRGNTYLTYRKRFSALEITAVWDFGMEEGTRYENDKYGVFEKCRDLAVSNRDMASISYNHIRVSRMPMEISGSQLESILKGYEAVRHISAMAGEIRLEMMASGMPPARISEAVNEKAAAFLKEKGLCLGSEEEPGTIAAGPHNFLALEDDYFADVWAVRQLEESMSIRRLTLHELGHAISDAYGVSRDKRIRRLLSKCRDGFEDREEFCAECFMASELTDRIPLANDVAAVYRACAGL